MGKTRTQILRALPVAALVLTGILALEAYDKDLYRQVAEGAH